MKRKPSRSRARASGPLLIAFALSLSAMAGSPAQPTEDPNQLVQRLIGQLKSDDPEVRRGAADELGRLPQPEAGPAPFAPAISALIEALEDEDASVRASAVRALGPIVWRTRSGSGSEPAIPLLIDALLQDADANVRGHAAFTLGCIGSRVEDEAVLKPAIQPLIGALRDEAKFVSSAPSGPLREDKVCAFAAFALSAIAPRVHDGAALDRAMPLLIDALVDPNPVRVSFAMWLLRQAALAAQDDAVAQAIVSALIEALQEDDADLREQICVVLSMIAPSVNDGAAGRAVRALSEMLHHDDPGTRRSALQALTRIEAEDEDPERSAVDLDRAAAARNLKAARTALEALRSWVKDLELARHLLLEIDRGGRAAVSQADLCRVYVYLGYIADREVKREEALSWYGKAVRIEHAGPIQKLARQGLERPLTWIKHLDQVNHGPAPPAYVIWGDRRFARDVATPADALSPEERVRNFEILATAVGQVYGMFGLKRIDWPQVVQRFRQRLDGPQTTEEFYFLLYQLVAELRDSHSQIVNYSPSHLSHGPRLQVDRFGEGAYVVNVPAGSEAEQKAVKVGSEIVEVDGMTVKEKLEHLRPIMPGSSTEHAFRRYAYFQLLWGRENTTVRVKLKTPEGETSEIILARDDERLVFGPSWAYPFQVTRLSWPVKYGRHPSGVGYIHLRSFAGDSTAITDQFETALTELRRTPALILDIRENGGGSPPSRIVRRFLTQRTLVAMSHDRRRRRYLTPLGRWQYVKPVALLTNAGTGSAGDIFASYMGAVDQVVSVGSTTHGNTGGGLTYVLLPCGLVVWVSGGDGGYDATGRPKEGTGQKPDIFVEPTIEDFLAGRDPVIDKAVEVLQAKIAERE